jgi:hypothetical protein
MREDFMFHSDHIDHLTVGRRRFLQGMAESSLGAVVGATFMDSRAMAANLQRDLNRVASIDPTNAVNQYRSRGLEQLSDASLYRAVVGIVSKPARGVTSFTLHAPLEVMARYGLLRFVQPAERELARLQMVTSGAVYANRVRTLALPASLNPLPDLPTASTELTRMFHRADPDGLDAIVQRIAGQFGLPCLVSLLAPLTLPTLTGASHSHIGLWLLLRHGEPTEVEQAALLRVAARALDPTERMRSFSGLALQSRERLNMTSGQIERDLLRKLANPPKGRPASASIRFLVESGEATGNADRLFGDLVNHDLTDAQMNAAFRAILRVAAHEMLQDDVQQAKFGWSHCLTLPQSAFGLGSFNMDRKLALAAALVWITAYRSVLSRRTLDFSWTPAPVRSASLMEALQTSPQVAAGRVWHAPDSELDDIRVTLATQASIRNDIHLVKYTRATFDMGTLDPAHSRLYLAAAAHLCAVWMREYPRQRIQEHLLDGRTTP